jgi:hypothetical protein
VRKEDDMKKTKLHVSVWGEMENKHADKMKEER